ILGVVDGIDDVVQQLVAVDEYACAVGAVADLDRREASDRVMRRPTTSDACPQQARMDQDRDRDDRLDDRSDCSESGDLAPKRGFWLRLIHHPHATPPGGNSGG